MPYPKIRLLFILYSNCLHISSIEFPSIVYTLSFSTILPWSTCPQSVAELLGISHKYYKRLESFDKSKPISIKLLLKVLVIW